MFKREIRYNFKNFIIWTLILLAIFLVVFLIYPSIINSENVKMIDQMMEMFPEELLTAFNMDISSLNSVFGWLKSEGFVFVLLIIGCFSGILGANILVKEESDKTIEYLNSLPIKREDIVISKVIVGIIYIILMVLILGIFNYIGLKLSGDFNEKQYILLASTPLFSSLVIFLICMFISTFTHKAKKMMGISLGFVLISYVLQMLSSLSESTEFLKYFSVFTLADIRNVITNITFNWIIILLTFGICIVLFMLIVKRYKQKELV